MLAKEGLSLDRTRATKSSEAKFSFKIACTSTAKTHTTDCELDLFIFLHLHRALIFPKAFMTEGFAIKVQLVRKMEKIFSKRWGGENITFEIESPM